MPRIAAALAVVITLAICIGFNTVRYPVVLEMVAQAHQLPPSDKADQPEPTRQSPTFSESDTTRRPDAVGVRLRAFESPDNDDLAGRFSTAVDPIPFDPVPDPRRSDFPEATRPMMGGAAPAPGDPIRPLASPREAIVWNPLAHRADSPVSSKLKRAVESPTAGYVRSGPVEAAPSSKYGFGPAATTRPEPPGPESDRSAALIGRRPLVPVETSPQAGRARKKKRATPDPPVDFRWGGNESDHRGTKVERLPAIDTPSEIRQRLAGPTTPGNRIPIYPSTGTP